MDEVRINKTELLEILKKNRGTHREEFLAAQKAFRETVVKRLDQALEEARNGVNYRTSFTLPEPQDHTKQYDTVIRMLELSIDDNVTLQRIQFQNFVEDEWSWTNNFKMMASGYATGSY